MMSLSAFNLVREAIEYDRRNEQQAALIKYTEALKILAGVLFDDLRHDVQRPLDSSAKKILFVLNQCMERMNDLFDICSNDKSNQAGAKSIENMSRVRSSELAGLHSLTFEELSDKNDLQNSGNPASINCGHAISGLECIDFPTNDDPIVVALEQNRQLTIAHNEKLKTLNLAPSAQATLNLSLQRQLSENLEIARQQKQELDTKRERTKKIALDTLNRNRETARLSQDEKHFIIDVQEFEAERSELRLYSRELNAFDKSKLESVEFRTIFSHYLNEILTQFDHPFCVRMRSVKELRQDYIAETKFARGIDGSIRIMINQDLDSLSDYLGHSLTLKPILKPKKSQLMEVLHEIYIGGLMTSLVDYFKEIHSNNIEKLNEIFRKDTSLFSVSWPAPNVIKEAAKTLKSFNDGLTVKAMLKLLVDMCKMVSSPQDPENGTEKLDADNLICIFAAVIVESKYADVVIWLVIMEELIDLFDDGKLAIGEEGFCLTLFQTAVQYILGKGC